MAALQSSVLGTNAIQLVVRNTIISAELQSSLDRFYSFVLFVRLVWGIFGVCLFSLELSLFITFALFHSV